ncbi:DUF6716 putative glycosyltransferase [Actinocorallia sp. A-T 12471]|uniref:DUF6716 putative glycosyltransferase n=1 Tax=Actinocorallia sp. A-T 12471 TaxID=3089813 RepID=UPI0029CF917D|nr:DUF6716 putative glycosyltransferase [Actinocorallia sp. A-T 12471]MDX6744649.1 DUF6716 putative glycosyltransferase [Actinocorallia sp. A-T 12471]
MRILAVADSDSYLKWGAALLRGLPGEHRLVVVRSPITPSEQQRADAVSGTGHEVPPVVSARGFRALLRSFDPDAVLLACTGPVVRALAPFVSRDRRRVLVTGLPGISVPATRRAWKLRASADLFVVHSAREVEEFAEIGRSLGLPGRVVRASLPFLDGLPEAGAADRVVFATQAKVPRERSEREGVLHALAALALSRPDLKVVVKLRALPGEEQTHRELLHYAELWRELPYEQGLLEFDAGPMRAQLASAAGFATVSSTAALEAIAAGVPLLVLADFGVSAEMINLVFEDSGVLGSLDELARGRFKKPEPRWCRANYFHPPSENDWADALDELVASAASLPPPRAEGGRARARLRARARVELPPTAYRALKGARRALRGG